MDRDAAVEEVTGGVRSEEDGAGSGQQDVAMPQVGMRHGHLRRPTAAATARPPPAPRKATPCTGGVVEGRGGAPEAVSCERLPVGARARSTARNGFG